MNINDVIKEYLNRGIGSMNKNDFEVWIFNEWHKTQNNLSDYEISRNLRIPESKVKRLKYEASLKYSNEDNVDDLKKIFLEDIKIAKYKKESSKLQFVVKDKVVRQYISDLLTQDGRFLESSLTSETVHIYVDDFIYLLDILNVSINKDKIIKEAEKKAESNHDFPTTFTDILKSILEDCSNKKIGPITTETIIRYIKDFKS